MRPIVGFPIAYFITTVSKDRRPLLRDIRLAQRLATMIRTACTMKGFTLLGFSILPDHVHLLVIHQRILERMRWEGGIFVNARREGMASDGTECGRPSHTAEGDLSRSPAVGDLMRSIKGTFSRTLQQGHVWQRRYHLRHVGADDLYRVAGYIRFNFRKHQLNHTFGQEPFVWMNESIFERML